MNGKIKEIIRSLVPALVFLILYSNVSFRSAIIGGFISGVFVYGYKLKQTRTLTSFDYLGMFGVVIQTIIGFMAENPMTYFIYPIVSNGIYFIVFATSLLLPMDITSFFAKDYVESDEILSICKPAYRMITIIWSVFFALKVIVKLIGITSWSFEMLYGISWLMGTPMTVIIVWFSFTYPENYFNKYKNDKKVA